MPSIKSTKRDIASISGLVDSFISDRDRDLSGTEKYHRARKEWTKALQSQHEDITIEELISDKDFFGQFNIWPAVKESLCNIWHKRNDYEVVFRKKVPHKHGLTVLKKVNVYALNHLHARRKAKRQWPTIAAKADDVLSRKPNHIHTIVYEMPRGTGKDFEMALITVLLVRDLLVQIKEEFYGFYNLNQDTRISINLMNRTESLAKRVTFAEVVPKFNIPFFLDYFPPSNVDIKKVLDEKEQISELRFPRNIVAFPGSGSTSSTLGYALAAMVLDECNNMAKNISSSQTISGTGEEGTGDAATDLYIDGKRRIESRLGEFVNGIMETWGMVICLSQSRTAMDFTKKLEKMAITDKGILYKTFPFWERKPLNLCGERFIFDTRSMSILDVQNMKKKYEKLEKIPAEVFGDV
jgi:hypothetical protein